MTRDDRVHHRRDADDRIDGTDPRAEITADTEIFVDASDSIEACIAQPGEQGLGFPAQHTRKPAYGFVTPWRAAVDGCVAGGYGLRISTAAGVAALRTLDSRQEFFQPVGAGVRRRREIVTAKN